MFQKKWVIVRSWWLKRWTKIPEKKRLAFLEGLGVVLNYLVNALLLAVPFGLLVRSYPYWVWVLSFWVLLPVVEHYYVWFRRDWENLK